MSDVDQSKQPSIAPDMNLGEVAARYPQAARVMMEYGLHCVGCFASAFDSVEDGARIHGMDDEELTFMVNQMNEEIQEYPEETLESVAIPQPISSQTGRIPALSADR